MLTNDLGLRALHEVVSGSKCSNNSVEQREKAPQTDITHNHKSISAYNVFWRAADLIWLPTKVTTATLQVNLTPI